MQERETTDIHVGRDTTYIHVGKRYYIYTCRKEERQVYMQERDTTDIHVGKIYYKYTCRKEILLNIHVGKI